MQWSSGRLRPVFLTLLAGGLVTPAPIASATTGAGSNEVLSLNANGASTRHESDLADVSADGAWVSFASRAGRLVEGEVVEGNLLQIYLRSQATGETTLVSRATDGTGGNANSFESRVSADGRFVLFESDASNLVAGDSADFSIEVYLRDVEAGTTTLVATGLDGEPANSGSSIGDISADNRFVVFSSNASNLVEDDNNETTDVFLLDRTSGTTTLVSRGTENVRAPRWASSDPTISADGRVIVYHSDARDLVPNDDNHARDIFAYSTATGATKMVSRAPNGAPGSDDSSYADVSSDGQFVAFTSSARNLTPEHFAGLNVYVRNLRTGATALVSRAADGSQGDGSSLDAVVSDGGTHVAFQSMADNLVVGDTNNVTDVFVVDMASGETTWVSRTEGPYLDRKSSVGPAITADGATVVFAAYKRLIAADRNQVPDVYRWSADAG